MDHFHLVALVVRFQDNGDNFPDDVIGHLRALRELPQCRAQTEDTERLLAGVLRAIDDDALLNLVSIIVKDDRPN
jgi:hypothetical protein